MLSLIEQISPFDLQREGKKPVIGKRYFAGTLEEMIMDYHLKQMSIAEEKKGLVLFLLLLFLAHSSVTRLPYFDFSLQ
jgi:hypothetical protein